MKKLGIEPKAVKKEAKPKKIKLKEVKPKEEKISEVDIRDMFQQVSLSGEKFDKLISFVKKNC